MKLRLLTLITLTISILVGCQVNPRPDTRLALNGSWTLKSADEMASIPDSILLMLHSDSNSQTAATKLHVSGYSGVNRFTGVGSVNLETHEITTGMLASTRKMGPDPQMKFEQTLLQALQDVNHFEIKNDQLVLSSAKNKQLTFVRGAQ